MQLHHVKCVHHSLLDITHKGTYCVLVLCFSAFSHSYLVFVIRAHGHDLFHTMATAKAFELTRKYSKAFDKWKNIKKKKKNYDNRSKPMLALRTTKITLVKSSAVSFIKSEIRLDFTMISHKIVNEWERSICSHNNLFVAFVETLNVCTVSNNSSFRTC